MSFSFVNEREDSHRHREIETSSYFFGVGGGKIEDDFYSGEIDVCIAKSGSQSFFGFFDRGIGESDDFNIWKRLVGVRLDYDFMALEAEIRKGFDFLDGHKEKFKLKKIENVKRVAGGCAAIRFGNFIIDVWVIWVLNKMNH